MATYWENSFSFGLRYVSWYKYVIVSLDFSHLDFWSGNLFLIAPSPDLCLLVPVHTMYHIGTISDILHRGVDSLDQWLEQWMFILAIRVRIPSGTYMYFLVTNFHIRKLGGRPVWTNSAIE